MLLAARSQHVGGLASSAVFQVFKLLRLQDSTPLLQEITLGAARCLQVTAASPQCPRLAFAAATVASEPALHLASGTRSSATISPRNMFTRLVSQESQNLPAGNRTHGMYWSTARGCSRVPVHCAVLTQPCKARELEPACNPRLCPVSTVAPILPVGPANNISQCCLP
jgi:hypothetical protein